MSPWSPDALILAGLRASTLHQPAEELAAKANLPPELIAARVSTLREAGFDVEFHPQLGFRLCTSPDRLIADDLWARLGPQQPPVREIIVLAQTGSTNDVAASLGRQGAAGGLLVIAESQTAGRGRFGRRWVSAPHRGIWMSLLLRPELPIAQWTRLTTWVAVALAGAIDRETGARCAVKWPNDLQLDGRKIAGILIEMGQDKRQRPFAVVGIGINANHESTDFPPELLETAQSLRMATGQPVERASLLVAFLRELQRLEPTLREDFTSLVRTAGQRSSLLGKWVAVQMGGQKLEGRAEGLDEDGHLLLRCADHREVKLTAGEVTLHTQ